jgi:hypothetical protein
VNRDTVTHTGPGPHFEATGAATAVIPARTALPEPFRVLAGDRVVVEDGPQRVGDVDIPPDDCSSGAPCPGGALAWVATAAPGESCRFVMTDRESGEVVIDADVAEWSSGASWWRDRESRLFVETDCVWSVRTAEA